VEIQVQNVKDSKGEMLENNSEMLPLLLKLVVADQFRIQSEKHRKMSYKLKKLWVYSTIENLLQRFNKIRKAFDFQWSFERDRIPFENQFALKHVPRSSFKSEHSHFW
jgi:hypothetical protein